jgi:hypothetical protein
MSTPEEKQVLVLLAKEWDIMGPPGIMDISDIVSALALAPGESLEALRNLYKIGLTDMNKLKTSAFLTPDVYAAARDREE